MRLKLFIVPILTVSLFAPVFPAFSQVVQRRTSGPNLSLSVGFGPSGYDVDWGHGRMYGGAIWADWYPPRLPRILHGLSVEVEAREISLRQVPSAGLLPSKEHAQDTAGSGVVSVGASFAIFIHMASS